MAEIYKPEDTIADLNEDLSTDELRIMMRYILDHIADTRKATTNSFPGVKVPLRVKDRDIMARSLTDAIQQIGEAAA